MSKPVIAIVGRPNVGKSTLFNKLIGERRAIVEDTPGVTRDRIYGETEWRGKVLTVIDTGGIEPKTDDVILAHMRMQAEIAIESADAVSYTHLDVYKRQDRGISFRAFTPPRVRHEDKNREFAHISLLLPD